MTIYYARVGAGIKIGHTTQQPEVRVRNFYGTLLATEEGDEQRERQLHQQFRKHLVNGQKEVFEPCPELKARIKALSRTPRKKGPPRKRCQGCFTLQVASDFVWCDSCGDPVCDSCHSQNSRPEYAFSCPMCDGTIDTDEWIRWIARSAIDTAFEQIEVQNWYSPDGKLDLEVLLQAHLNGEIEHKMGTEQVSARRFQRAVAAWKSSVLEEAKTS